MIIRASSGIDTETTRVLTLRETLLPLEISKKQLSRKFPIAKVDAMKLDLSSMASVRKFESDFSSNNARIIGIPFILSKDKIELLFATNHIAMPLLHFLHANEVARQLKCLALCKSKCFIGYVSWEHLTSKFREGNVEGEVETQTSPVTQVLVVELEALFFIRDGAATMHPEVKGKSGQYFKNSNIDQASEHRRDVKLAKKLWDFSIKIVE
ncbi:hypothetical protein J1N35_017094 [Gossypium stocksii]|uniref:Uncharacterized protein n=1 Tax=Gossypium stocksii TaxID=47602 RepID=A0A9D3VMK0_9ROSI|nr:hypothetical protein J1N35_017094 [Gossypium stocksii]